MIDTYDSQRDRIGQLVLSTFLIYFNISSVEILDFDKKPCNISTLDKKKRFQILQKTLRFYLDKKSNTAQRRSFYFKRKKTFDAKLMILKVKTDLSGFKKL
jgi:hypothetical protein